MPEAARLQDPVAHSQAMTGLLTGLIAGALIGAAVVATGGAALVVVAAVAAGATAGAGVGEVLGTVSFVPMSVTGVIQTGSPNVRTNSLPAARAHLDVDGCTGMPPLALPPHVPNPLAQGSATVNINGMPAARRGDLTACGSKIYDGSHNVRIGGATATTDLIQAEVPAWINNTLMAVGFAAAVILAGPVVAVFGLIGGMAGGYGGAWLGGQLFGKGSDAQKFMMLGGAFLGGWGAAKAGEGPAAWLASPFEGQAGAFVRGGVPAVEEAGLRPVEARPCEGEPVDAVTGEVLMWKTDVVLPGTLPIELKRNYASGLPHASCFGPRWASTWGQYVEAVEGGATYYAADGRSIAFDVPPAEPGGWTANSKVNKIRLRRIVGGFEVRDDARRILRFASRFGERFLPSAIEDANGNSILFTHDETGALREVRHSGGYLLKIEGTVAQIHRVSLGSETGEIELIRYEYDEGGRLSAVIDGSGLPFRYQYDKEGRVTRWEDRKGTWYAYRYDLDGRCVEAHGPEAMYHYRFFYNDAKRINTAIDSLGNIASYVYNEGLQVVEKRDRRGGITRTAWDERSNKVRETDPAGRETVCEFDADGNLTNVRDSLGRTTVIQYNEAHLPVRLVDANEQTWVRAYDERGDLIEAKGPDGTTWRYARDGSGNLMRLVDPEGHARAFGYDALGLLAWATDWKGHRTGFVRDVQGRVVEREDVLGHRTQFRYNLLGKLAAATLPDGGKLRWEYDAEGNLERRVARDGRAFSYSFGPFDLLQEVRKPAGGRLQLRYDSEARLRRVENELGQTWWYEYDEGARIIREVDFHGREQRFQYDGSGLCVQRVNGAGEAIVLERDGAGQLVRKRFSDGSAAEFEYDGLGRVARAINGTVEVKLERDAWGRVLQETQGEREVKSGYDARGLRVKRRTASGHECAWNWDANGQATALRLPGDELLEFVHDAAGREVERRLRGGLVVRQEYDELDRLASQWAGVAVGGSRASATIVERAYRYDENDNPIEIRDRKWGTSTFTYNADGRIASVRKERGVSEEFTYDLAGDIATTAIRLSEVASAKPQYTSGLKISYYGKDGRLERVGDTQYSYDDDGRVVEKREGRARWRCEWTTEGRLNSLRTPSGERWTYEYDAFGRRVRKQGPGGAAHYVWDGSVIAEEIGEHEATTAWVYEQGSFRPLLKQENGKTYTCVTDQVGTPRELVTSAGEVAWSAAVSVWGKVEDVGLGRTECPVRFQGQWFDAESGLHYNFHRYYDPEIGQYISPDPIGLEGGTRSYGYVHNPLTWVDPLGLAGCTPKEIARANKAAAKTMEDALGGKIRRSPDYHGRLPADAEADILANPDAVYLSEGSGRRMIFSKGGDVVITEGPGSARGTVVTSYGPSGPQGPTGASIFGGAPTAPGSPITPGMITGGTVPAATGGTLPPAVQVWP